MTINLVIRYSIYCLVFFWLPLFYVIARIA